MEDISTDDCDSNCFYQEQTTRKPKGEKDVVFDNSSFLGVKSARTINPEAKQAKRDVANDAVAAFLAKGSKITKCPSGRRPKFRFGQPRPPAGSVGSSRSGDLSRRRWRAPVPSPSEERDLLRSARAGNDRAKQKLFEVFDRLMLKITSQYSGPTHAELYAAGIEGFCYAVSKFDLTRNTGLKAFAEPCIRGAILTAIKEWQKGGIKSDTRADRYLFAHPAATAEQIVETIGGKLKAAQEAIARVGAWESYDTTEGRFDKDNRRSGELDIDADMQRKYSAFDKYSMSPQLRFASHSDKTTTAEEVTFGLGRDARSQHLNNKKIDLRRRAIIAARCSQYPECGRSSELWSWHRYSADIRSAAENRRWQRDDWYLEPNFSDDRNYKPERIKDDRKSTKAIGRSSTTEDAGDDRESGESRLQQRERFRAQSYSVRPAPARRAT